MMIKQLNYLEEFLSRRTALAGLAAGAGVGLAGFGWDSQAAEPPPETTRIRLLADPDVPIVCYAPIYLVEEFLRQEGFTDIGYNGYGGGWSEAAVLARGEVDFAATFTSDGLVAMESNAEITFVGGVHSGCVEIYAHDRVRGLTDVAGHRLLAGGVNSPEHIMLSLILGYVGVDPVKDVEWVFEPDYNKWAGLFADDRIDVLFTSPTPSYAVRDMKIGHVILNSTLDDPWRHYICCMLAARSAFVRDHPVAAKRAVRAFMKARDFCASDPRSARDLLLERGVTDSAAYASMLFDEIAYGNWRDYDPRSTVRFFALRLRETGFIDRTPESIIASNTDFRFFEEIRQEMKS